MLEDGVLASMVSMSHSPWQSTLESHICTTAGGELGWMYESLKAQ